ncbi:hypothetical protein TKK_0006625 [Trichogramma kaykai]|uniref:YDG domain-containing protein n=3 Tax=Trichogramma kaykai TaxID=54128 RepID=A0ABD2XCG9_9HYME
MEMIELHCKNLRGRTIVKKKFSKENTIGDVTKVIAENIGPNYQPVLFHENKPLIPESEVGDCFKSDAVLEVAVISIDAGILSTKIYEEKIGQMWSSRKDLLNAGVHTELIDSISGHPKKWAHSIIYSGENELDEDQGQKIQFAVLGRELEGMKEALARNFTNGMNVRVVRQFKIDSPYENDQCYKYDGVYKVSEYRPGVEKSGRCVWLFTLERDDNASKSESKQIFRIKRKMKESVAIPVNPIIPNDEILLWELDSNIEVGTIHSCGQNLTNVKLLKHVANENSYSLLWYNEVESANNCNIIPFSVVSAEQLNDYIKSKPEYATINFNNGYIAKDLASAPDVKVFKKLISKDISSIRYDGIFKVYAFWTEVNKNGLKTGRYLLINATISIRDSNAKNVDVEDPIKGIAIGSGWPSRAKLAAVHPPPQAGICGSAKSCASSIVLSGKYEGDIDMGDIIVYTGCGGRDQKTKKRNHHQSFSAMNEALARNCNTEFNAEGAFAQNWKGGTAVRVVRKLKLPKNNPYIRDDFWRYDGTYKVVAYWKEKGIDTYENCRFLLNRDDSPSTECSNNNDDAESYQVRKVKIGKLPLIHSNNRKRQVPEGGKHSPKSV